VRHRLQKARRTTQRVRSTPFILFLSFFTVSSSPPPRLCRHVIDDVTQVSDPPGSTFWARTARHVTHNTRATPSHRLRAGAARHVTHGTRATSSRSSPSWCHRAATGHQSPPLFDVSAPESPDTSPTAQSRPPLLVSSLPGARSAARGRPKPPPSSIRGRAARHAVHGAEPPPSRPLPPWCRERSHGLVRTH
jgi:hypothetical protein